jgi:hypothetical protein
MGARHSGVMLGEEPGRQAAEKEAAAPTGHHFATIEL